MGKSDLKAAMESLQVKKPLRLPASAPTFKVPPSVSQDVVASPVVETPKVHTTSQDQLGLRVKSSQPEFRSTAASASEDVLVSQDQKSSQDFRPSADMESPEVKGATVVPRASQPRRATEQDRAVTEAVSVKSKLSTGYTRVPNSLLMEMVSGDLSRNEMKIMLLIARMTISFNRRHVPLSKGVIERMTGVQGRSVLEALQALHGAGLIEKIPGDHNSPNRLGLVFDPQSLVMGTQVPKASRDATSASDATGPGGQGLNSTYKKDNSETIDLRKKIPLSSLPEPLRKYFSDLKPRRKREAEFEVFEDLRADFSEDQIVGCLEFLQARGLPASGAACHSPMAYLAKAMAEILAHVELERDRSRRQRERNEREAQAQRVQVEQESIAAAEWTAKELAFRKAFPALERQCEVITKFCQGQIFRPHTQAGRIFAIDRWWEELPQHEREKLKTT